MSEHSPRAGTLPGEGLRERKRRETRQRIAEAGLRLFLAQGYEATTLDAIAAAAGISRRSFFSHFKSKDDIVMVWQGANWASLRADLLTTSPDVAPLDAVRDIMVKHGARYTAEEMVALDRLMRSSESLLARKQAFQAEQELALFQTLCEVWRQPERRMALRMVAMMSMGAMKLALQAWNSQPEPRRPIADCLLEAFDSLKAAL